MIKLEQKIDHTFIPAFLSEKSNIVDLGANQGGFSAFIKKEYGCNVYAIEAAPYLFNKIKNLQDIKIFNFCITDFNGPAKFNIHPNKVGGSSNKLDKFDGEIIEVPGITLKKFIEMQELNKIDLLKVDIEGAEIDVFKSISTNTLNKISQITIEFHDFRWPSLKDHVNSIKKKLKNSGFYCASFSLTNNGDVLFIKKDLIKITHYFYLKYFVRYVFGARRLFKKITFVQDK